MFDPDLEPFMNVAWSISYIPKAIFPSEMFMFYRAIKTFGPKDHIFESGVGYGGSTTYLSKLFPKTPITSVDMDRYQQLNLLRKKFKSTNVKLIAGESMELLPRLVQQSKGQRIAVLIDGPKGKTAMKLMRQLIKLPRVELVAIHDLHNKHILGESSKHPDFRLAYDHLDAGVGEYHDKHHPKGPGLTLFRKKV